MAERKNTLFDRPGGYAMPSGATSVQRRAASETAAADIRLLGDSAAPYEPALLPELAPEFRSDAPE